MNCSWTLSRMVTKAITLGRCWQGNWWKLLRVFNPGLKCSTLLLKNELWLMLVVWFSLIPSSPFISDSQVFVFRSSLLLTWLPMVILTHKLVHASALVLMFIPPFLTLVQGPVLALVPALTPSQLLPVFFLSVPILLDRIFRQWSCLAPGLNTEEITFR